MLFVSMVKLLDKGQAVRLQSHVVSQQTGTGRIVFIRCGQR